MPKLHAFPPNGLANPGLAVVRVHCLAVGVLGLVGGFDCAGRASLVRDQWKASDKLGPCHESAFGEKFCPICRGLNNGG